MPMVEAFPLGLILTGTSKTTLADGSSVYDLTALGTAVVEGEEQLGTVSLSAGAGAILAGMEFLATLSKTLFIHTTAGQAFVLLLDNVEVLQVAQAQNPPKAGDQPIPTAQA